MSVNKKAGTLYETIFITESLMRGLDVSTTIGDYSQYDCIIDNGNKLFRIQVKGTRSRQSKTGFKIVVAMGARKSEKNKYADDAYDMLAALVVKDGERHWYIIPKADIGDIMSLKLFPNPTSKGKWEKYRHAWDLICQ